MGMRWLRRETVVADDGCLSARRGHRADVLLEPVHLGEPHSGVRRTRVFGDHSARREEVARLGTVRDAERRRCTPHPPHRERELRRGREVGSSRSGDHREVQRRARWIRWFRHPGRRPSPPLDRPRERQSECPAGRSGRRRDLPEPDSAGAGSLVGRGRRCALSHRTPRRV